MGVALLGVAVAQGVGQRAVLAHGGPPAPEGPPEAQEFLPREVSSEDPPAPAPPGSAAALRRQAWARMIRKVFEVDPLQCPRCGTQMEVVKDHAALGRRRDPPAPARTRARLPVRSTRAAGGVVDVPATVVVVTFV